MSEHAIREALVWIISNEQWLIEGPAALAPAPVLEGLGPGDGPACCILTGADIALETLRRVRDEAVNGSRRSPSSSVP